MGHGQMGVYQYLYFPAAVLHRSYFCRRHSVGVGEALVSDPTRFNFDFGAARSAANCPCPVSLAVPYMEVVPRDQKRRLSVMRPLWLALKQGQQVHLITGSQCASMQ